MDRLRYTDLQLLERIKRGDEAAFTEIYNRYWKLLFSVAVVKLQNPEDAKELVQDVFINIWKRREELSIEHSIKSYLAAAVKYRIYNFLSKQYRIGHHLPAIPMQEHCAAPDIESQFSLNDMMAKIELATAQLPPQCKLIYQLSREENLSHKEIAVQLGISNKTVDNQISKALKVLKAAIRTFLVLYFF